MKKRKIVLTLLALTVSVSMLVGCGSKTEKADGDSDGNKTVEVTMLYADNANYPYKEDWKVWDIIEEHTGVTFDVQAVPESDYVSKQQLVFNSGDIPSIVTKTFASAEDAMSGLLLPISEYVDEMPNFKKFVEENGMAEELDNTRMGDGKYYTLPVKAHTSRLQDQQWLIRTDIFEENNIPVPTTLDELHDAGVKLKELYPDSTPITNRFGSGNLMSGLASAFETNAGWTIGNGMYYNRTKDKWIFSPASDEWKEMLQYTNKLVNDGVLDEEFATLDSTVYEQRIVQGTTFMMYDWVGNITRYNLQGKESDENYNVAPIYPVEGKDGKYAISWKSQGSQGWVFPATLADDEEQLDAVLKLIDWCYTDEAEALLTFGIEDETYITDENGTLKYKDENIDYGATMGLNNNSLAIREHNHAIFGALNAEQMELFDKIAEDQCVPAPNPESPLSMEKIEETKVYASTLLDYANSMMENFIFGKESFDNWDAFVKGCEERNCRDLEKEYNDAWENR